MSTQPYLTPTYITVEINGLDQHFYACSLGCAFRLKNIAKPIVKAMATLLIDGGDTDQGMMKNESFTKDESLETVTAYQPIGAELADLRHKHKQEALDSLLDALLDPANKLVLAEVIVDSLRETYKKNSEGLVDEKDVRSFARDVDLPTFVECLKGVGKANIGVFGPLAQRLSLATRKLMESPAKAAPSDQEKKSPTSDASSQPSPKEILG